MPKHRKQAPRPASRWLDWGAALLLLLAVIGSALGVTHQVYQYRETFGQLQQERRERERLDVEWSRLLIEQQTFGATTQIGGRAVMRLGMYSPPPTQTVTVNVSPPHPAPSPVPASALE